MSAARDRRRLMAWERHRRRALLLGLSCQLQLMSRPHRDLMHRVSSRIPGHGWAWTLPDPYRKDPR